MTQIMSACFKSSSITVAVPLPMVPLSPAPEAWWQ
jgi:hypothetical protein